MTQMVYATAAWTAATPMLYRDVERAAAKIVDPNEGFNPDNVPQVDGPVRIHDLGPGDRHLRRRETNDNPIHGGDIEASTSTAPWTTSSAARQADRRARRLGHLCPPHRRPDRPGADRRLLHRRHRSEHAVTTPAPTTDSSDE
ncbi:hypothetical protein OG271_03300 [Micromonospora rifamycinica]|uniref:hypothetical protein n=1 Tax=Micromonospora rifamycinica TaxID=291594 RepID=UPI002E28555B|nr:hypothetical protein [Micromonospora rifamycinica]